MVQNQGFWLAEEFLDHVQDTIMWPFDKLYDIKYWFNNRFVTKSHALNSNLKKGQWHEFDERMLHCLFDELVNFVEIEKAWINVAMDKEAKKRYEPPFWTVGSLRFRTWRSPEAGMNYLLWEASLKMDDDWVEKGDPRYGQPTGQALAAKETIELYDWWKNKRPNRPDPHEVSGWTALCEKRRSDNDDVLDILDEPKTVEEREAIRKSLDISSDLEKKYEDEDEEMLIRLIKIRKSLWT